MRKYFLFSFSSLLTLAYIISFERLVDYIMKDLWKKAFVTVTMALTLAGCSNDEGVSWLFFSGIPSESQEEISAIAREVVEGSLDELTVHLYSPTYERLINEIAAHHGDILFVEESMLYPAVLDPEGLIPLDDAVNGEVADISSAYKEVHPETGEEHVYALPIESGSYLLKELGEGTTDRLFALIPVYSDSSEESIELLRELAAKHE